MGRATGTVEPNLADWLLLSRPHLSEHLVDDEAFDWLVQVGRHLPGDAMAVIEVRLGPGKAPVDLSVRLIEPHQAHHVGSRLTSSLRFLPQFLTSWATADWRPEPAHSIWLEFDLDRNPEGGLPDPVVCARLRGSVNIDWILNGLVPRMHGVPATKAQATFLKRAWAEIQPGCSPLYVFSLRTRGTDALRLEIYAEEIAKLWNWLDRTSHPKVFEYRQWFGTSAQGLERAERWHLSIDVGRNGSLSRLGLEGSFRRLPNREPGWGRMLDDLADLGACTPTRRLALDHWSGHHPTAFGSLIQTLSHFKIVATPKRTTSAKAYLLLQHLRSGRGITA